MGLGKSLPWCWLENLGFIDFAGSTVVHSIGGWAALAESLMIGPRIGKYSKEGKVGLSLDTIFLWPQSACSLSVWFGFNPGSTTTSDTTIAMIFVNTNLTAAAGAHTAHLVGVQLIGIGDAFVWSFGCCFILFKILKATVGLRVTEDEEMEKKKTMEALKKISLALRKSCND